MSHSTSPAAPGAISHLGTWDAVSIIVGIVIGVGIHETAPFIFSSAGSPGAALACWLAAGLLSFVGALCFAELATAIPKAGGDYHYLRESFGSWAGFLFGWLHLTILKPASIGMVVFIFANYAAKLFGYPDAPPVIIPIAAAVALSLINIAGIVLGKRVQNSLAILKLAGFAGIILSGLLFGGESLAASPSPEGSLSGTNIGLALVLILYAYGGWNDAALVTSEIKNPQKNLPRALFIGVAIIAAVYLLVNLAYLRALGFDGARNSTAIAADTLGLSLGAFGYKTMCLLVMVSALSAANGMIFAGARIYPALAADFPVFRPLGKLHPKSGIPVAALVAEGLITVALILLIGSESGRNGINSALLATGFDALKWEGHGGFDTLFRCTAPFFWALFLMTGLAVFLLRIRKPDLPRPFRVPLYPLTPVIFCATSAYMVYSSSIYAGELALLGAIPLALGVILYASQRFKISR